MRIALLTIPGLYGAYFVREIRAHFPDAETLVLCQVGPRVRPAAPPGASPQAEPPRNAHGVRSGPPAASPGLRRAKSALRKIYWKGYEAALFRMNPLTAAAVFKQQGVVMTTDINAEANVERLAAFAPDFILIFGGGIVRPPILALAKRAALNVHGGKLPQYRGANGIKWMLWNGDLDRLCATVHVAAAKVDAGAIVREARVDVHPGDTYRTIFARLHVAGVRAMADAVRSFRNGSVELRDQEGPARTYRAREWSPEQEESLDARLAVAVRERGLRSLPQRATFHAYRRLHRYAPALFAPKPEGPVALLYHHVAPEESPYVKRLGITISPDHFEQHIRYLTTHFDVVPFSALSARSGDPRAVAVTFDDGFTSVATTVLPIIERYSCPIKLYVC